MTFQQKLTREVLYKLFYLASFYGIATVFNQIIVTDLRHLITATAFGFSLFVVRAIVKTYIGMLKDLREREKSFLKNKYECEQEIDQSLIKNATSILHERDAHVKLFQLNDLTGFEPVFSIKPFSFVLPTAFINYPVILITGMLLISQLIEGSYAIELTLCFLLGFSVDAIWDRVYR